MTEEDLRQFIRQMLARFDRSMSVIDRRLEAQTAQLLALTAETRENPLASREVREEMRAQRDGFLALIDELRRRPASDA